MRASWTARVLVFVAPEAVLLAASATPEMVLRDLARVAAGGLGDVAIESRWSSRLCSSTGARDRGL